MKFNSVHRSFIFMTCISAVVFAAADVYVQAKQDEPEEPLRVRIQIDPEKPLAGQVAKLRLGVVAGSSRPELTVAKIASAQIFPIDSGFRQIASNAIGNLVEEKIMYTWEYFIIADRPGALSIPPFRATTKGRSGASKSLEVEVRNVPLSGRPSHFLGGVGSLEIKAAAEPVLIPLGQAIEFSITLEGPGALGTHRPDLKSAFRESNLHPEIVLGSEEVDARTMRKVYWYSIRPRSPGSITMSPISISTFDPATCTFQTKVARPVSIRVEQPPRFDASKLELPFTNTAPEKAGARGGLGPLPFALAAVLFSILSVSVWAAWRKQTGSPRSRINRLKSDSRPELDPLVLGKTIHDGVVDLLRILIDRPMGPLAPNEASEAFTRITGDDQIGRRMASLIEACDHAQFAAGLSFEGESRRLRDQATSTLDELAAAIARRGKHGRFG